MRIMTAAFALGTALVLCSLGTSSGVAQARTAKVVREPPRERLIVTVPVVRPYWDFILFHDIVIALRTTGSIHTARL